MYSINNKPYLKTRRITLRKNLTLAEAILWNSLKQSKLGVKFRRQHSIEKYILDFYCPTQKLAIELDGYSHDSPESFDKDKKRDTRLSEINIKVIRFLNEDIYKNLAGVLGEIEKHLKPPRQ